MSDKSLSSVQADHMTKSNKAYSYGYMERGNEQRGKQQFDHKPYSAINVPFNKGLIR